jgi:hypothetical protein
MPRLLLFVLLALKFIGASPGAIAHPSVPSSRWSEMERAMGDTKLDGTLRLAYSLGEGSPLENVGFDLRLEHKVEVNAHGRATSVWQVSGLRSALVLWGRHHLLWRSPSGKSIRFEISKIGRALSEAGSVSWRIRKSAAMSYEIRALDGRAWNYVDGRLVSATHPELGELRVSGMGALLTNVDYVIKTSKEPPLLHALYRNGSSLRSLQINDRVHRFEWDDDGQLGKWTRADGEVVEFRYRNGLLSSVVGGDDGCREFTWNANPGYGRGDSVWPAPVHLGSSGENAYNVEATTAGLKITRYWRQIGGLIVTIYNPRTQALTQTSESGTFTVRFARREPGLMIESLSNCKNENLEMYYYDIYDRLKRVARRGEPDRVLSYDDTGRLIDVSEAHGDRVPTD